MENIMENKSEKTDNKDKTTQQSTTRELKDSSIFSRTEIRNFVKGFVSAWIKKNVSINFPTASTILANAKWRGKEITEQEASTQEVDGKQTFVQFIMVCTGAKPSTPKELERAISQLFNEILIYRAGERIEGKFWESNLEDKLCQLERGLQITNDLVKQLVELHRSELID